MWTDCQWADLTVNHLCVCWCAFTVSHLSKLSSLWCSSGSLCWPPSLKPQSCNHKIWFVSACYCVFLFDMSSSCCFVLHCPTLASCALSLPALDLKVALKATFLNHLVMLPEAAACLVALTSYTSMLSTYVASCFSRIEITKLSVDLKKHFFHFVFGLFCTLLGVVFVFLSCFSNIELLFLLLPGMLDCPCRFLTAWDAHENATSKWLFCSPVYPVWAVQRRLLTGQMKTQAGTRLLPTAMGIHSRRSRHLQLYLFQSEPCTTMKGRNRMSWASKQVNSDDS